MVDKPAKYIDEDGSIYGVEIVPPDGNDFGSKYHVDMVRSLADEQGLAREQRLTVGQYHSWGEAEEQLYDLEDRLKEKGLSAWEKDVERLREQPFESDVVYMAVTYPPEEGQAENSPAIAHLLAIQEQGIDTTPLATGERETIEQIVERIDLAFTTQDVNSALNAVEHEAISNGIHSSTTPLFDNHLSQTDSPVQHVDGGGTAHWFGIVEREGHDVEPYELRYFRALELEDGSQLEDSYPVMPLSDNDPSSAWALSELETYLQKGEVYLAQQLAHDVADAYEKDFPEPLDLPSLDPRPEYYFGYGIGPNNKPSLEAVKTWMEGAERRFDTLTIGEYGMFDEAAVDERELETLMDEQGVEMAMNLAETMAVVGGYLDADRDDPRIFFENDAPPDPFQTTREEEIDDNLASYGVTWRESHQWETEAEDIQTDEDLAIFSDVDDMDLLQPIGSTVNYAVVMQSNAPSTIQLEVQKVWQGENGEVETATQILQTYDVDVETEQAQADLDALLEVHDERGLQSMMHKAELQATKNGYLDPHRADLGLFDAGPPDNFKTLAQQLDSETNPYWNIDDETETIIENPYWRLDTIPVNDPEGESLGYALHMVVYDGVAQNPDHIGTPTLSENEPFRMLEMAHFETTDAADKFGKEFNGYLMPGLLEGPELAEEVAKLEGHSVEWIPLEEDDLKAYQNGEYTLTHNPSEWHLYNPNAERDARIVAEGIYTVPIYDVTTFDESKDDPKVEPTVPDFDL